MYKFEHFPCPAAMVSLEDSDTNSIHNLPYCIANCLSEMWSRRNRFTVGLSTKSVIITYWFPHEATVGQTQHLMTGRESHAINGRVPKRRPEEGPSAPSRRYPNLDLLWESGGHYEGVQMKVPNGRVSMTVHSR